MTDQEQLIRLLRAGHACVSILTYEEAQALSVVRAAVDEMGLEMMEWSVVRGLRDAIVAASPMVSDSEHPAAALFFLSTLTRQLVVVMFDLVPHLKEER